ncbi:hypothetical protein [Geomonas propionica]|uniref:Uncharacterized protein n=1 Tax=Geomonas propionica TaxID=2798582 RepID=A0ABS0YP87_9BACT|nr:hypothetical protein [Geomonas propionica]MBJ6799723.1 hypothetical protein [Geomonas propionica]
MKGKTCPNRHPRVSFPVVVPDRLDLMPDRTQFLISRSLLASKWRSLEEATNAFIPPGCGITHTPVFSLNPLIESFEGVSVLPSLEITASFVGGLLDGHLRFRTVVEGKEEDMLSALQVTPTMAGFIEAIYLTYHLRTKCAFWHGFYGRNYTLLPNYFLLRRLQSPSYDPQEFGLQYFKGKVDRPVGIRVAKRQGKYYVSCMAIYAFGNIVDMTVRVADERITALWPPETIYNSGARVMY